jgi:hypothetical protein
MVSCCFVVFVAALVFDISYKYEHGFFKIILVRVALRPSTVQAMENWYVMPNTLQTNVPVSIAIF